MRYAKRSVGPWEEGFGGARAFLWIGWGVPAAIRPLRAFYTMAKNLLNSITWLAERS